ncbi:MULTISPECIES: TetR/AcrR family transcriptional regulator [Stenotrophomonas]|uniref:TetR family transcriptional regulator n=1 Tax=Stenotrophomonas nitritireducens TaxID=83617 RepID=A0ABR5NHE6_9GAMM|nr:MULTISPECIES: TetR/AcrR family transcriptional regulator [Stenotrophomonas]KQN95823.1 TetR family transcriptional regulator [Stenotrophomonas sp. Leaf70]KRG55624.1 TetR family transcriptional regulator [Stenotrophomonas nitritireducens]
MNQPKRPLRLTDRKRAAILRAAVAEFRELGFAGTSMDRVAAAAGVSKRTVYNHFASKDELFTAILWQLWEASQSLDALAYDPARPMREQLLAFVAQKLRLLSDASFIDLSRVAMAELVHAPERARVMMGKLAEKEEGLATWIRAAQADGRLRDDIAPADATHQLQGMVKAFAFWPQIAMGAAPLDASAQQRVMHDCVDMFLAVRALTP